MRSLRVCRVESERARETAMPTSRKKIALLDGLDQYSAYCSVICVFGSVVGCVVVPLITQSIESIILSAILISITAKTIHSRSLTFREEPQDDRKRPTRESNLYDKRTKKKKVQSISSKGVDVELVRRQRQEEMLKQQENKTLEKQQKLEEKRLKKARKREEKLKLKEEEEREKTRDVHQRREREEKKGQKQKRVLGGPASINTYDSLTRQPLVPRERKNSSSSSGSSRSSRSLPRPRPPRMTARNCFSRALSDSNLPPSSSPLLPSPSSPLLPSPSPTSLHSIGSLPTQVPITCQQSKQGSTQRGITKEKTVTSTHLPLSHPHYNHSTNNNHPPQTHGQVYAVNPLAPSNAVTMATPIAPATITKTTVAKGCNWNEQLYYWSLDQAGLTKPLQYGWDPVLPPTNYGSTWHATLGNNLQLQVQPATSQWNSRGPFSAPEGQATTTPSPPSPSNFGAIGNEPMCANAQSSPTTAKPHPLGSKKEEVCKSSAGNGGYSLFSDTRQTIFSKSLLTGQVVGVATATKGDKGAFSKRAERFDEWPTL